MYISFLLPYNIRHTKAPFLWVFYKQLSSFKNSEVHYIGNKDYFSSPRNHHDRWELSPSTLQRQNYDIPTERVIENLNKSIIVDSIFDSLQDKYSSYTQVYSHLLTTRYKPLEEELDKIIASLVDEQAIDAILSWCNIPSLKAVADKYNLKVIYNELGPVRSGGVFSVDLAYLDFSGVNGYTEAEERYAHQNVNKDNILSHEEILTLIVQEDYLPVVLEQEFPTYEVGIVLQVEDDSNILAYSNGLNSFDLISLVQEGFKEEEILIRPHPGGYLQYDKLGTIDNSKTSIEFIKKCRRIVTINSSVALESILLKKPTYILGDSPISFLAYNQFDIGLEKFAIAELNEKLNFIVFNYLIPNDFIFKDVYYKFRLSNPTEDEIYQYHVNYLSDIKQVNIEPSLSMESMIFKQYLHKYHLMHDRQQKSNDKIVEEQEQQVQLQEAQLQVKEQQLNRQNIALRDINIHNQELNEELNKLYNSKRWKLFYPLDRLKEQQLSKELYVFIKSNKLLRTVYHKLPLSNDFRWKIRQFISTGKISKKGSIDIVEDNLNFSQINNSKNIPLPLVSIIIPCYNQGCYLWESVPSAYASYSGKLEVIIIDDGSTDAKTKKCLREIKMFFPDVQIVHKKNGGLSSARNAGIKQAKGKFIQFLDADDILAPGKVDIQIGAFQDANNIVVSNYLTSNGDCSVFYKTEETIKGFDLTLDNFLFKWERGLSVPIHCGLFPKQVFEDVYFDEELSAKEDWFLWINLLLKGYKLEYIDIHSVVYRVHTESMVRKSFVKMSHQWEKAYKKIASLLKHEKQNIFLVESEKWLDNYYCSNPNYKEEIKNQSKIVEISTKKEILEINHQATNHLILELKKLTLDKPIVSIVIPIFNHYDYLFECILSATKQGDVPIELICVDDNSSDARVQMLLKEFESMSPNITIILHEENRGISYTQNEAVNRAKGKYIAFLDCDDYLKDNALSIVYDRIKENQTIDYIFTDRTNIDKDSKILYDACYKTVRKSENIKDDLLDRMIASHLKVIKKETYVKVGGSDEKMSGIQDWDLALKIAEVGELGYIDKTLYCHRLHENSVTSSDSVAQYKKTNILRREFSKSWLQADDHDIDFKEVHEILKSSEIDNLNSLDNVKVFNPENLNLNTWYCPKMLKESFEDNKICIFDARGETDSLYIEFLKDFNSYFDLILCDRLSVSSQIIGTLWSEKIIWTPLVHLRS